MGCCGAPLETQSVETWALHWPFTGVAGVGLPFYGFFKAWLEWRGCCLKFSVLLCCAIMVLWLKRDFCWGFFVCVSLKYKVSVSYSPLCHLKDKGPSGTSNPCLPDGEPTGWGDWFRAQSLASYGEPLQLLLTSHSWAAYPELWVLIPLHLFPPNLSWCNSFITSLVVMNIFFYFSVYSHQQLLYK